MANDSAHATMSSLYKHGDDDRYRRSLKLFLERSDELKCTKDFLHNTLPNILASIGNGKSKLNVIGVGTGEGTIDMEILSQLCLKHPGVLMDNEVVEPSRHMLHDYQAMVSQKSSDLEHIKFTWNMMTAAEFEEHWRKKNITKKVDFVHMVQMMYFVKDPEATISFFQSLLGKNGKLMIILVSDESYVGKLRKAFDGQLCTSQRTFTSAAIRRMLDARGVPYQRHDILAHLDITECFTEGDEDGELLLDFVTHMQNFSLQVSSEVRQKVLRFLRDPQCSVEKGGRVFAKHFVDVLILDALN